MKIDDLMGQSGEWLRGAGPESDIVISSRVRLARNMERFPFLTRATEEQRSEIHEAIRGALDYKGLAENGHCYVDLGTDATDLTQDQLDTACISEGGKPPHLPEGLKPPQKICVSRTQ